MNFKKRVLMLASMALVYSSNAFSQLPTIKWTSPAAKRVGWLYSYSQASGYVQLFYKADSNNITIMDGPLSSNVKVSIAIQRSSGEGPNTNDGIPYFYSTFYDLSGDSYSDIYILRVYSGGAGLRYGFRIVNGQTGNDVYVFDDLSVSYQYYGTVDFENDRKYELAVTRSSYPNVQGNYQLEVYSTAGVFSKVERQQTIPGGFSLSQNYPNPFNPSTIIEYELKQPGNVSILIYNSIGQRVRTLIEQRQDPGSYFVNWNGDDVSGARVTSGTYFYELRVNDLVQAKKMLFIR